MALLSRHTGRSSRFVTRHPSRDSNTCSGLVHVCVSFSGLFSSLQGVVCFSTEWVSSLRVVFWLAGLGHMLVARLQL